MYHDRPSPTRSFWSSRSIDTEATGRQAIADGRSRSSRPGQPDLPSGPGSIAGRDSPSSSGRRRSPPRGSFATDDRKLEQGDDPDQTAGLPEHQDRTQDVDPVEHHRAEAG